MPLETSPESPIPVRQVSRLIGEWIDRLGSVWVEGEIAQLNRRPGASTVFLTLRDPDAAMSLTVTCRARVLDVVEPPLMEGQRVVVRGAPSWYAGRGTLSLGVTEIRPIGLGDLLARIEALRTMLAGEGLFRADRKKPLPFLPRKVGLISGRASAAERDVLDNAARRWPGVAFEVRSTAVQGAAAVPGVVTALAELDAIDDVEVIVIARGGGSVEDLLPFSDEVLIRAVAACTTPVVSAIGHEQDTPLLDLVADVRASTPTDAARRVVPDLAHELAGLTQARARGRAAVGRRIDHERSRFTTLRQHPVLASAAAIIGLYQSQIAAERARGRTAATRRVERYSLDLTHQRQRLHLLSPASTLERGYAIVQRLDGTVVRSPPDAPAETDLRIRVAGGSFDVRRRP